MVAPLIDEQGYRSNVGIIIVNGKRQLFWAKRIGQDGWQFPQGGMHEGETVEETLFRELKEEVGLDKDDVEILGCTHRWLKYKLPRHLIRYRSSPVVYGQKQKWFLLKLCGQETKIDLAHSTSPEFDAWRWVNYWYPVKHIIGFKRRVYSLALKELSSLVFHEEKKE